MEKIEALKKICWPSDTRPHIAKPFRLVVDGQPWVAATNGHMVLAFAGAIDGVDDLPEDKQKPIGEYVSGMLSRGLASTKVYDLVKLKSFIGAPEYDVVTECSRCNGAVVAWR